MNKLDHDYQALLNDILIYGHIKKTRNGHTRSVFGRTIRHNMADGFPLLTTKKLHFRGIVAELLWFLRGSTDIRELWKDKCHIWDGDWYKRYSSSCSSPYSLAEMKALCGDTQFDSSIWDLGPIYGAQWRRWGAHEDDYGNGHYTQIDQIQELINELFKNPDSRRLLVNAWNVGQLSQMTLPPCHYGFQLYTRELSLEERREYFVEHILGQSFIREEGDSVLDKYNTPKRAISLIWNQRSCDTALGIPYNLASYGLLLEIFGKITNMVPEELIGNLGDVHIYENQIQGVQEQLTRTPFELPKVVIDEEPFGDYLWGNHESPVPIGNLFLNLTTDGFRVENYQSHPSIKMPLSN